ncbi:hypothetical protein [Lichenicoccus sp.]|uniref:hypothetical protein n=1 Tax=Lichenicoccus sp. TaxID=2781899 RepID=UPI003D108169
MAESRTLAVFTICSNNYVPAARVLLQSVRQFHAEADLYLCLADEMIRMPGLYDAAWTIVEARSLPIRDFAAFAFRYDILEFNTALKPFMFQHLLEQCGYDAVLYFDPDIELFRPLDEVTQPLAEGASLILTPHMCAPCESPAEPNDLTIMRAGIYNLGFLGAARCQESSDVIAWWARRLRYECVNAQSEGLFVDQKFMDLAPAFAAAAHICRDTTMNVAYWNLRQRALGGTEGAWTVDGAPLGFFHYSGFDPEQPARLSKYDTRLDGAMTEPLQRLTESYATKRLACGHGSVSAATYAYGRFASGTAIHPLVRRMFRQHQLWPQDPFDTYEAYLHERCPGTSRADPGRIVTNFMQFLHGHFPHLHTRLDLAEPAPVRELVDWFVIHSANDLGFDLPLIEPAAERLATRRDRRYPARHDGGTRSAAADAALDEQIRLALAAGRGREQIHLFEAPAEPEGQPGFLRVGIPLWHLACFPEDWLVRLNELDEVWAPSRFLQTALAGRLECPVVTVPLAFESTARVPRPRHALGLPEHRFLFFASFDCGSCPDLEKTLSRENPHGAIAAFRRAFPRDGMAGLVLHGAGPELAPDRIEALRALGDGHPDIFLLEGSPGGHGRASLIGATDALLSLHRSEGVASLCAEALRAGRPAIATGYAATRELLTERTGYPVGFQLIPVAKAVYQPATQQSWAEPDIAHAAWLMQRLFEEPGRAMKLVSNGRALLQRDYSHNQVAAVRRRRLQCQEAPRERRRA